MGLGKVLGNRGQSGMLGVTINPTGFKNGVKLSWCRRVLLEVKGEPHQDKIRKEEKKSE